MMRWLAKLNLRKRPLSGNEPVEQSHLLSGTGVLKFVFTPASLLYRKSKYQTIANNLPGGGALICEADKKERISRILERVAVFFRQRGHFVRILPSLLM
jgi:hypothetical protein